MFGDRHGIDLTTFVGGLVRSLTKAQQVLSKARRERIEKHFVKDDDGVFQPVIDKYAIGDNQMLPMPTFCMAQTNAIGIDAARITCAAKLVDFNVEDIDCEFSDHKKQVTYIVQPVKSGRGDFEIEIKFGRKMDCEAEDRLNEYLTGLIETEKQD